MTVPFTTDRVRLTSGYGSRVLDGKTSFHAGYDLVGIGAHQVTAAIGGKVAVSRIVTDKSNRTWEWGNYVCVHGDDGRYYYCPRGRCARRDGQHRLRLRRAPAL